MKGQLIKSQQTTLSAGRESIRQRVDCGTGLAGGSIRPKRRRDGLGAEFGIPLRSSVAPERGAPRRMLGVRKPQKTGLRAALRRGWREKTEDSF